MVSELCKRQQGDVCIKVDGSCVGGGSKNLFPPEKKSDDVRRERKQPW